MLSQLGMMFSGDFQLTESAHAGMSLLATVCHKAGFFADISLYNDCADDKAAVQRDWQTWIQCEMRRRIVFLAWVRTTSSALYLLH